MSHHQPLTPELRDWLLSQAAAGHAPDVLVKAMQASGWTEAAAREAIRITLAQGDGGGSQSAANDELDEPGIPVPEPLTDADGVVLRAGDRDVRVLASLNKPRVIVFGGLLDDDECDEMVVLARQHLSRSETVQTDTGSSEVNAARTSEGMFFHRGEHELCARIEARIAALLRWPVEHGEGLQVLRYGPGAEYKPHYDYFDPAQPGTPALLQRGGQRVASLVCYLNTPERGGSTVFPDIGLDVAPVKGNAVFFSYDRPRASTGTLHGGSPVLQGEKWVATKWLRERRFD